jgi:protein SCO1/2
MLRWLLLVVGVGAFVAGIVVSVMLGRQTEAPPAPAADETGYVLDQPRALPDFTLVDQDGQPFGPQDFRGHWSLVYFGYTYCPDICPMSLAEMARVKQVLAEQGGAPEGEMADARYYLVSVDPRRDSPERLREYVAYFDPAFRGLTGDKAALDAFTRAAGVVYQVPDNPDDDEYLVGHSSTITLLNPDGRIHAIFTTPLEAGAIAGRCAEIGAAWSGSAAP